MNFSKRFPQLDVIINQITLKFNPVRIILFGSYANGIPNQNSDLDLLVILSYNGKSLVKSIEILSSLDPYPDIPIDLITYREEDVKWRYEEGDPLIREAYDRGILLYEQNC